MSTVAPPKIKAGARLQRYLRTRGKDAFVFGLPPHARLLDVGCGNASPLRAKALRPDIHYVGLDVGDYEQTRESVGAADEYIITTPSRFAEAIASRSGQMDAVVSSHNLEHCDDQAAVLKSIALSLRPGGRLYLSFPSEATRTFPSRRGTLNFFDDPTHQQLPDWSWVLETLKQQGMQIDFDAQQYRPGIPRLIGTVVEPVSRLRQQVMPLGSTWAYWGFESVIWASKPVGAR
jgi:SAM-dependent methyltransferase